MKFWHLWKNQRMLSWYILTQSFYNSMSFQIILQQQQKNCKHPTDFVA